VGELGAQPLDALAPGPVQVDRLGDGLRGRGAEQRPLRHPILSRARISLQMGLGGNAKSDITF
jgi:hypothetical protein